MDYNLEDVNSIAKQEYENAKVAIQKLEKDDSVYAVGVNVPADLGKNEAIRFMQHIVNMFQDKELSCFTYLIRDRKPDLDIKKLTKN